MPDPVAILVAAVGLIYLDADQRVRRRRGPSAPRMSRTLFLLGLGVVLVALVGPLDAAVETSFTLHMLQHLLLTMLAAPLLLAGAPLVLALQAWPGVPRRALLALLHGRAARLLSDPLVAWSAFFAVLWGAHLTGSFDASLRSPAIHAAEHAAFLGTALLFWMPVLRADPTSRPLSYPARILYLFVAMPAMAFLGVALASASHVLYPTYAATEGPARALADQRAAGAVMWVGSMIMVLPTMTLVLLEWMRAEEREGRRADARLAATPPSEAAP